MYTAVTQAVTSAGLLQSAVIGLLVAAAGVPLGFVIYQIYFYLRWNSPFSREGLLPPLLVGRQAELKDFKRELEAEDLALGEKWRLDMLSNSADHQSEWHYEAPFLAEIFRANDPSNAASNRHDYLMETLHSLGTSYAGATIGYGMYMLMKWKLTQIGLKSILIAIIGTFILMALLSFEDKRNKTPVKVFGLTVQYAAELALSSAIFVYISINPALNKLLPLGIPLIICIGVAAVAALNSGKSRPFIIALAVALVVISLLATASNLASLLPPSAWPSIRSMLLFGCLTTAFLRNRQNVRETMVAFDYYHVKMYLIHHGLSATPNGNGSTHIPV
jgi:putative flippase GtrA